jgi:cytochrome c oxidase cbb3-type subunit 3
VSEFTSGFWDLYIALLTVLSIVACAVFLKSQSVRKVKGEADSGGQTTGHTWDEDLAEYNNPLPRWWSWLFYLTIFFSLIYLVLYPGLGSSWKGTLGWTQVGQLEREQQAAEQQYGPIYKKFAATEVQALVRHPEALAIGQKLFLNNCAQCHASDGGGSRGFPNLTSGAWQWGGDAKTIATTIADGRTGVMPPFGAGLGEQGVKNVAHYVRSLSGLTADSIRVAVGKELFMQNCVACHGADGKGNRALGAPDLTDKNWLHGSSEAVLIETIGKGRSSHMPAHKGVLDEARIHLLTAYVLSLPK